MNAPFSPGPREASVSLLIGTLLALGGVEVIEGLRGNNPEQLNLLWGPLLILSSLGMLDAYGRTHRTVHWIIGSVGVGVHAAGKVITLTVEAFVDTRWRSIIGVLVWVFIGITVARLSVDHGVRARLGPRNDR